jgi:hypothetical protein
MKKWTTGTGRLFEISHTVRPVLFVIILLGETCNCKSQRTNTKLGANLQGVSHLTGTARPPTRRNSGEVFGCTGEQCPSDWAPWPGGRGPLKNDCFHMFDRKVAVVAPDGRSWGPLELTRTLGEVFGQNIVCVKVPARFLRLANPLRF